VELAADISAWIAGADPLLGGAGEKPITMLIHLPSLSEGPRFTKLGDGAKMVLEACRNRTISEVCGQMSQDYDLEPEDVLPIVRRWLEQGVLR
jgi:hypothetical protein